MHLHALIIPGALAGVIVSTTCAQGADAAPVSSSAFRWSTSTVIEETYDSNVYLQSTTPLADRSSWVTSVGAVFDVSTKPGAERTTSLAYAPTWTVFHSERAEDFLAHRFSASTQMPLSGGKLSTQASALVIDGPEEGITWTGVGGAPAVGGPSVRDRRDQAVYRASVRSEWTAGHLVIRPVGTLYWGDFRSAHLTTPGYQNCADRGDLSLGSDVLTSLAPRLQTGLGLRVGGQDQARLLGYPEEYDNRYVRVLALLEGPLSRWCSTSISIGPEFRHYGEHVHATFGDRSVTNLFVDASMTFTAGKSDTIALLVRQFQQMSSSGRGAFDDRNFDIAWRHAFSKHATGALVLHAYNTEFLPPAVRDDWVYTARAQCSLTLTETLSVDGSVLFEEGASDIPAMPGREYTRQAFSLGLRARF
ncbi:MAG: hypothetical protein IAE82_12940 [Opitutaceae bacterium]|nr:hypothetical protein [Opitutaceae bacterium]